MQQKLELCSLSQGIPKIAGKPPETRKMQGRTPLQVPEEVWPRQQLDFRLLASRSVCETVYFCSKPPSVALCYVSPRKLINYFTLYYIIPMSRKHFLLKVPLICPGKCDSVCNWNPSLPACHHKNQTYETDAGEKETWFLQAPDAWKMGTLVSKSISTSQCRQVFIRRETLSRTKKSRGGSWKVLHSQSLCPVYYDQPPGLLISCLPSLLGLSAAFSVGWPLSPCWDSPAFVFHEATLSWLSLYFSMLLFSLFCWFRC